MIFLFFFIVTSNYKNSMYPRSILCEEAKIKQRTPLYKELCEISEKAIWESGFTSFFLLLFTIDLSCVWLSAFSGLCYMWGKVWVYREVSSSTSILSIECRVPLGTWLGVSSRAMLQNKRKEFLHMLVPIYIYIYIYIYPGCTTV